MQAVQPVSDETSTPRPARRRLIALLPLAIFLGLSVIFLMQLLSGRDLAAIPSALIGQPAPVSDLPPVEGLGLPGLESDGLRSARSRWSMSGRPGARPAAIEHPVLLALSRDKRFVLAGVNYKDTPDNARRFLGDLGNPFAVVGTDATGRTAIDWGVYGVPETFIVGRDGKVLFKHVGPLDGQSVETEILPQVEKALATLRVAAAAISFQTPKEKPARRRAGFVAECCSVCAWRLGPQVAAHRLSCRRFRGRRCAACRCGSH